MKTPDVIGAVPYESARDRCLAAREGVFHSEDLLRIAAALPQRSLLVPAPSRTGLPTWSLTLARRLAVAARSLDKQTFVRPLVVGSPRESLHDAKHEGRDTSDIRLGFRYRYPILDAREVETLRSIGCKVVVVDNVIDTGRTAREMAAVLGDVLVAAIACTGRHLETDK